MIVVTLRLFRCIGRLLVVTSLRLLRRIGRLFTITGLSLGRLTVLCGTALAFTILRRHLRLTVLMTLIGHGLNGFTGGFCALLIFRAVYSQLVTVQIDGIFTAAQAADLRVAGQCPGGIIAERNEYLAGIVDLAAEGRAAGQVEVQIGVGIHGNGTFERLILGVHGHLSAVFAFITPALRLDPQQIVGGVIHLHVLQVDFRHGIGDEEHTRILRGQGTAVHGEAALAGFRIPGHRLIQHDSLQKVRLITVLHRVVAGHLTVIEGYGIFALDHHCLGHIRGQRRIICGNVGGGIDRGGAGAVGFVSTAVHGQGTAAPITANRCAGAALGGYGQVIRIQGTAAGDHDTAGIVLRGGNGGIADIDGTALTIGENRIAVGCLGIDF